MERYDSEEKLLEKELESILDNADEESDEDFDDNNASYSDSSNKTNLDEINGLKHSENSIHNLVEKQYIENYGLTKDQFNLIKTYFEQNENDANNIRIDRLVDDIYGESKAYKSFKAGRKDLENCLRLLDQDNDEMIDFNDYIDFLTMTFTSKFNFRKKILSLLNARKFSHQNIGYLNQNEAYDFFTFLKRFYSFNKKSCKISNWTSEDNEDDDHIYFYKDVSYKRFVSRIAFYFKDKLFIEW